MKYIPNTDSQKALCEENQSKLRPEILVEKQRLLQIIAEKKLKKMRQ